MHPHIDLDDFLNQSADIDYRLIKDNRSTSDLDDVPQNEHRMVVNFEQNYLEKNIVEQMLLVARQHDSFSQMIKQIEQPILIDPEPDIQVKSNFQEVQAQKPQLPNTKKHKKNSNAIKKIGRIILNRVKQFQLQNGVNQGVVAMISMLNSKCKEGQNPKDYRDRFNISHLQALFSQCSKDVSNHNLRVAKNLFNKHLRKQILQSCQIKEGNKLIYLNTLKCSSLRFCNYKLALRLQLSEILD